MDMKINPVYKKELKVAVRTPKFALKIVAYNLVLASIALLAYYISFYNPADYYSMGEIVISRIDYSNILVIYAALVVIEIGLILFAVPSFTAGSIAGEREKQTLDILLTTRLTSTKIVIGKLLSSISLILLLYFTSLPVLSIVFSIGGITWDSLIQLTITVLVIAFSIGSIGIFFSTKFKKSILATVVTYGIVIALVLGTYIAVMTGTVIADKTSQHQTQSIGYFVMILLFNPVCTIASMLTDQFGSYGSFSSFVTEIGKCPSFILNHWTSSSLIVQAMLGTAMLGAASCSLNPIKKPKKKKEKM